jgi:pimeloyl-ACP methyl ester carboxylesterase
VQECEFKVGDRTIAALCCGEAGQRPVLALHGWLDNAESFTPLAQQLQGCHLVALDMAGHGLSDHRGADGEYHIWSDLPDILRVVDQLGWYSFELLGHSRGALIAGLFASALPERVSHLVLLDSYLAQTADASDSPAQLTEYLRDHMRYLEEPLRVFASPEVALAARARGQFGPGSVEAIVRRNIKPCAGGWSWTTDARLKSASAVKLTDAHNTAIMSAWTMPTLVLLAEQGLGERMRNVDISDSICVEFMAGGHHFHMDESVVEIARRLQQFWGDWTP